MSTFDEVTQNMTPELATAVIKTGIEKGAFEGDVPADADQLLTDGRELCRVAKTAFDQGIRSETVIAILETAGISAESGDAPAQAAPPAQAPAEGADQTLYNHQTGETQTFPAAAVQPMLAAGWSTDPPAPADPPPAPEAQGLDINSLIPGYDDKSAKEIVEAMRGLQTQEQVEAVKAYEADHGEDRKTIRNFTWEPPAAPAQGGGDGGVQISAAPDEELASTQGMIDAYHRGDLGHTVANRERLSPPQEISGDDDPVMPMDLSTLGDGQLSDLHTRFHALDVRATYLLGIEEALAMAARRIAESTWGDAFEQTYAEEKGALGENPSASAVDSARSTAKLKAEHSQEVTAWRNRTARHEIEARGLSGRQRGYEKHVARLSREQSRREAQKQGAGG